MTDLSKLRVITKQEIRSCLISSKRDLTVTDLLRDYKACVGKELPFRILGYSFPEDFLKSIPDTVQIGVKNNQIILRCVGVESTQHIEKLVQNQKSSTTKYNNRRGFRGYRGGPSRDSRPNVIQRIPVMPISLRDKIKQLLEKHPNGILLRSFMQTFRELHGTDINCIAIGFNSLEECLRSASDLITIDYSDQYFIKVFSKCAVRTQPTTTPTTTPRPAPPEAATNMISSGNPTPIAAATLNIAQNTENEFEPEINPQKVKLIRKVLQSFPEGIWHYDFEQKYEAINSTSLEVEEMGFYNIIGLIDAFPSIFKVKPYGKNGSNLLLFDAKESFNESDENHSPRSPSIPDEIVTSIMRILQVFTEEITEDDLDYSYKINFNSNLPWLELGFTCLGSFLECLQEQLPFEYSRETRTLITKFSQEEPSVRLPVFEVPVSSPSPQPTENPFPDGTDEDDDFVLPGEKYTEQQFDIDFNFDEYFMVFVGHVDNPGQIWLQLIGKKNNVALEALMIELENFYYSDAVESYRLPESYFIISMVCAVIYPPDRMWHRAIITGIPSNEHVLVRFVDYGTELQIPRKSVCFLRKCFMKLPAQAINCRLAGLRPVNYHWSKESQALVLSYSVNKPLMARVTSLTYLNKVSVELCDTSGSSDIHINDVLFSKGLALKSIDEGDFIESPTFLNSGDYPSYVSPRESAMNFAVPAINWQPTNEREADNESKTVATTKPNYSLLNPVVLKLLLSKKRAEMESAQSVEAPPAIEGAENYEYFINGKLSIAANNNCMSNSLIPPSPSIEYDTGEVYESEEDERTPVEEYVGQERTQVEEYEEQERTQVEEYEQEKTAVYVEEPEEPEEQQQQQEERHQLRFCQKVQFSGGYNGHLVNFERRVYLPSGDISNFIYGMDIIEKLFRISRYVVETKVVQREHCPALFDELKKNQVTGFTQIDNDINQVVLYPLESCLKALQLVNHTSAVLKLSIEEKMNSFNPDDPYWKEIDGEAYNSIIKETIPAMNDRIIRLKIKRISILKEMMMDDNVELVRKLNGIYNEILLLEETITMVRNNETVDRSSPNENPVVRVPVSTKGKRTVQVGPMPPILANNSNAQVQAGRKQQPNNVYGLINFPVLNPPNNIYGNQMTGIFGAPPLMLTTANQAMNPQMFQQHPRVLSYNPMQFPMNNGNGQNIGGANYFYG